MVILMEILNPIQSHAQTKCHAFNITCDSCDGFRCNKWSSLNNLMLYTAVDDVIQSPHSTFYLCLHLAWPIAHNIITMLGEIKFASCSAPAFYFFVTNYRIYMDFFKNQNHVKLEKKKNLSKKLKMFAWNLVSCLNKNQLKCIWALKFTNISYVFGILANNIKFHFSAWTKVKEINKKQIIKK